ARADPSAHARSRAGRARQGGERLMRAFEYATPRTAIEAVELLATKPGAAVLAGGTDLIALMKDDVARPERLVDVKGIPELRAIRADAQGLRIGAAVTMRELSENAT